MYGYEFYDDRRMRKDQYFSLAAKSYELTLLTKAYIIFTKKQSGQEYQSPI